MECMEKFMALCHSDEGVLIGIFLHIKWVQGNGNGTYSYTYLISHSFLDFKASSLLFILI